MKLEVYEQRVLTPDVGRWLYHAQAGVISDKVYLGKAADVSEWVEITEAEKEAIEAEREQM